MTAFPLVMLAPLQRRRHQGEYGKDNPPNVIFLTFGRGGFRLYLCPGIKESITKRPRPARIDTI
jgi:hypothetical protein